MQYLWVYKKVEQLGGQTGFVEVEDDLAQQLIDDDCAQNPDCGAHYLKEIESGEYQTKVMAPAKKRINTKARAKDSDE
jgi:hypothetical protein